MKTFALAALLGLGLPAFAQDDGDRLLPEDTLGLLRLENAAEFTGAFQKTGLAKLLAEEEIKTFLRSIRTRDRGLENALNEVDAFLKKVDAAFGGSLEKGLSQIGRLELAVVPGEKGPAAILSMDVKDAGVTASLLRAFREDVHGGKEPEKGEVEGTEVLSFGDESHVARVGGLLVLCTERETLANVIRRRAKPPERSLATNPRYAHARKAVEVSAKSLFLYADGPSILGFVGPMVPPDAMQMVSLLGVTEIQYLAACAEGDGDCMLQKAHLSVSLVAGGPAASRGLLEKSPAELNRDPKVLFVQMGYLKTGTLARDIFARLNPLLKAVSTQLLHEGVQVDLTKIPVEALAKHLGEGQEVVVLQEGGLSWVSRSNTGVAGLNPYASPAMIGVISAIAIPGLLSSQRAANERNASASLKTLATAESDFRANDREDNKVNDFWTGDVAGLYCMTSAAIAGNADVPLKLIEVSIAGADAVPLAAGAAGGEYAEITDYTSMAPKSGYYFRAMMRDREGEEDYAVDTGGTPVMGAVHNNSRFGFCAYPANYWSSGKKTFIINEGNTMFWMDTQGKPVLEWPTDAELRAGWSKMD